MRSTIEAKFILCEIVKTKVGMAAGGRGRTAEVTGCESFPLTKKARKTSHFYSLKYYKLRLKVFSSSNCLLE